MVAMWACTRELHRPIRYSRAFGGWPNQVGKQDRSQLHGKLTGSLALADKCEYFFAGNALFPCYRAALGLAEVGALLKSRVLGLNLNFAPGLICEIECLNKSSLP